MSLDNTISLIKEEFLDKILDHTKYAEENILHIKGNSVLDVLSSLQNNGFNFLADITAIDNLSLSGFERYCVVYHLLSHETVERVTVKAYVPEDKPSLPSVESVWKTADWQEREIYDLFGIVFKDHPNLIRIMNPDDYNGHPLRKDYPRLGNRERDNFPKVTRGINKDYFNE
tara:strand:- start:127 stop:642 length:516 start_codon:yes stop_codon:yes gene_type:complete